MAKKTLLIKSKQRTNRTEASQFLHQLADKIAEGQVVLRQGPEEINLKLPQFLTLQFKADDKDKPRKGIEHRLEFEIKWFDDDSASAPLELG
jgi:amphi-Trp domain-containing protein